MGYLCIVKNVAALLVVNFRDAIAFEGQQDLCACLDVCLQKVTLESQCQRSIWLENSLTRLLNIDVEDCLAGDFLRI